MTKTYTLTLTPEQFVALASVLGAVGGIPRETPRHHIDEILDQMQLSDPKYTLDGVCIFDAVAYEACSETLVVDKSPLFDEFVEMYS